MGLFILLIILILVAVLAMLIFVSGDHYLAGVFKMLASTCFILLCVVAGGIHSTYGILILHGLAFSWWGDLFLISKSPVIFMLGLVAFFLAHVAYCVAFIIFGATFYPALGALALLLIPGLFLVHWLYPYLGKMRLPVLSYMLLITLMVALAGALTYNTGYVLILIGAAIFYSSDIFVARDRFVCEDKTNKFVGLPLYYLAQMLLAISVLYAR